MKKQTKEVRISLGELKKIKLTVPVEFLKNIYERHAHLKHATLHMKDLVKLIAKEITNEKENI